MTKTKEIMYDSPEAAKKVTVTGWVSTDGRFWGNDEHMARWSSCTHMTCECGDKYERMYTMCPSCREKKSIQKYNARPFKEWNGDVVYADSCDEYFCSEEEIEEYCEEYEVFPKDMRFIICEAVEARGVDEDYWYDDLPDDQTIGDVSPEIAKALELLNNTIRDQKAILSWYPGKFRTDIQVTVQPVEKEG